MGFFNDLANSAIKTLGYEETFGAFVGNKVTPYAQDFIQGYRNAGVGINADPSQADIAMFANVQVVGDAGAQPEIRFEAPFSVSAPMSRIIDMGTGEALLNGMNLSLNYVQYRGDGARVESSWELGKLEGFQLGDHAAGVLNELAGAAVGARLLAVAPVREGNAAVTLLTVAEVVGVVVDPTPEPNQVAEETRGVAEAPAAGAGLVEQLKELADLHAAGILTDEEFRHAKAQIFHS